MTTAEECREAARELGLPLGSSNGRFDGYWGNNRARNCASGNTLYCLPQDCLLVGNPEVGISEFINHQEANAIRVRSGSTRPEAYGAAPVRLFAMIVHDHDHPPLESVVSC